MYHTNFVFVSASISLLAHYSFAQNLTSFVCNARLPSGRSGAATLYDGEDTIYVFGGLQDYPPSGAHTLKYSISEDTIVATTQQLEFMTYGGGIVMDKIGNIYFLVGNNGGNYYGHIFQYFPGNESFVSVSSLHTTTFDFGLIKPDEDNALIIGGGWDKNTIQRLNLNTLESEYVAEIPKNTTAYSDSSSAIWVEEQGVAYIFDGRYGFSNVTKFDVSTNQFEFLPNYFPRILSRPKQAVWDGTYGYVIGGIGSTSPGFETPYGSIVRFDPKTGDSEFIHVHHEYEDWVGYRFEGTSAVYVEKLNRIYLFGGEYWSPANYEDKIRYISLDPDCTPEPTTTEPTPTEPASTAGPTPTTQPSTTTEMSSTSNTPVTTWGPVPVNCVGLGDAIYPYPGNCRKFVLCRGDQAYGFDCPEPLLFHQTGLRCTWPDLAACL